MSRCLVVFIVLCLSNVAAGHEAFKFGHPDTGRIMDYGPFAMSYDGRLRSARWVAEKLTKESLQRNVGRKNRFRADKRIPVEFRAELSDYRGSGFDRGHLAASGNHVLSREANSATFFLSNMSPQVGRGFNRGIWRELEAAVRDRVKARDVSAIYVFTGPLFLSKNGVVTYRVIGNNHLPVPTHYFKSLVVVQTSGLVRLYTFVLPNVEVPKSAKLSNFMWSVDKLEHWAGMDLWSKLPNEESQERVAWELWEDAE